MAKEVHHSVRRPGRTPGEPDVEIPVAADLATVPGIPLREHDVSFYSREYPIESQTIDKGADREWVWTVYTEEIEDYRKGHDERVEPLIAEATVSGDLEPTGTPEPGRDVTGDIRSRARELGFGEVGFTRLDRRYIYSSKKRWAKYEHAICLAYEQDYQQTQMIPSLESEHAHFGTYEIEGAKAIELATYIRSIGYHAQIHNPSDNSGSFIAMFVAAGLGQLGANGQLLSPHFGSRARLMLITTDAPVTYDEPEDYGIHRYCQICQCASTGVRTGTGEGEGLVAGRREEQAGLRPVPARDGAVRGVRRLHEGLPHPALRYEAGDGALRGDRRGARQGDRQPGGLRDEGDGLLRAGQAAPLQQRVL